MKNFKLYFFIIVKNIFNLSSVKRKYILCIIDTIIIGIVGNVLTNFFNDSSLDNQYILQNLIFNNLYFYLVPFYFLTGVYRPITRYGNSTAISSMLALRNFFLLFCPIIFISYFQDKYTFELSKVFLIWFFITFISTYVRTIFKDIYHISISKKNKQKVAIYGAGLSGIQLLNALNSGKNNLEVIVFIDDDEKLWGRNINGVPIKSIKIFEEKSIKVSKILISFKSFSKSKKQEILKLKKYLKIPFVQMPILEDMTNGNFHINSLQNLTIDQLLNRYEINARKDLLEKVIKNKVILITGAGGSIGSEILKQILHFKFKKIIIVESSEFNLYKLLEDIKNYEYEERIEPILGSSTNFKLIRNLIKNNHVDTIFHASAYKHVPLVEKNPIAGIYNNVFSTKVICEASLNSKVKKVVLISTDKAVRPSNVMGASKRLSEIILQAYNHKYRDKEKIYFCMVRFGNVLCSSGSVVPLFTKQIENGGPITITHKKIERFFMTIPEAAQLVIQSAALSKGGEVFLLDMGKPIKIIDLAKHMVLESGLTIKDIENPNGDIEIISTGLRPGEKLFEELLINSEAKPTKHPLIFKANENFIKLEEVEAKLLLLRKSLINEDIENSLILLKNLVPEWSNKK